MAADAYWAMPADQVVAALGSGPGGLSAADADRRAIGRGIRRRAFPPRWLGTLLRQFTSPIILILLVATVISMVLGDALDGSIIIAIIVLSGLLGFYQESRADNAVQELLASVQVHATVVRDGTQQAVPVEHVVPGDLVVLSAGSVVPADCRLVDAQNLLVDESALTGESFPVEKDPAAVVTAAANLSDRLTCVFFGSHVISGTAHAVAVTVASDTQYGRLAHELTDAKVTTAFEKGITRFGLFLVRIMAVLTIFIFFVNWLAGRPLIDSLLFALALAVGLTPQLLPAIVSLSLASGARRMAAKHVIVKRLDAIEDLGTVTVLCTDKTGTLTQGSARLDHAMDLSGHDDDRVLRLAALNAGLQSGFANPLDEAILQRTKPDAGARADGEVPYDFERKRLSVLTDVDGVRTLITKGALDSVLSVCATARTAEGVAPVASVRADLDARFGDLSSKGFRVVGIASKAFDGTHEVSRDDETGLCLDGLLCFFDPPKPGARDALEDLAALGVGVRLITGDNARAAASVAASVGIDVHGQGDVITGATIDALDDAALAVHVKTAMVFAEVEPLHKKRIVRALQAVGESVAFLGDGINDAPALRVADVGISVDTAVDVAKQAASVVLLQKGLDVVADGVRLGRQTFANTVKYIRLTTSASFGNMLSMAIASLFLPFLPLLPRQILVLNFLTDIPATALAADDVDPERTRHPIRWNIRSIRLFMLAFGTLSTVFDLLTFAVLLWGFHAGETLFQTAWFVVSTLTELAVMFSLRTARPIWASRPARLLVALSVLIALVTIAFPYLPGVAAVMGLAPLDAAMLAALGAVVVVYVAANEALKRVYFRSEERHPAVPAAA